MTIYLREAGIRYDYSYGLVDGDCGCGCEPPNPCGPGHYAAVDDTFTASAYAWSLVRNAAITGGRLRLFDNVVTPGLAGQYGEASILLGDGRAMASGNAVDHSIEFDIYFKNTNATLFVFWTVILQNVFPGVQLKQHANGELYLYVEWNPGPAFPALVWQKDLGVNASAGTIKFRMEYDWTNSTTRADLRFYANGSYLFTVSGRAENRTCTSAYLRSEGQTDAYCYIDNFKFKFESL